MWLEIGEQNMQLGVLSIDTRPTMWLEMRKRDGEQNPWLGTRPTMWLEIEIQFWRLSFGYMVGSLDRMGQRLSSLVETKYAMFDYEIFLFQEVFVYSDQF